MRATNWKKLLCLVIAAWMTLCAPASSEAFLTELIVGGSILAEVGGTVVSALPQISLFVSSVITLAKTSEEIADTVMSIVKFFVPSKKGDDSNTTNNSVSSQSTVQQTASIDTGSSDSSGNSSDISSGSSHGSTSSVSKTSKQLEVAALIDLLIEKFPYEMALLTQITSLEEGDSERTILGDGYSVLVSEVSEIRQELITIILDGIRSGDSKLVNSFALRLDNLDGQERVALVPVLSKIIEQGAAFDKLHSLPDVGLLASLTDIYAGYLE
jgi:hypothetical protein